MLNSITKNNENDIEDDPFILSRSRLRSISSKKRLSNINLNEIKNFEIDLIEVPMNNGNGFNQELNPLPVIEPEIIDDGSEHIFNQIETRKKMTWKTPSPSIIVK